MVAGLVLAAPAAAEPDMASDAVAGQSCDMDGPTFGYSLDGREVLGCVHPGVWVETAGWAGERTIGSGCVGQGAAVAPDGRGLICVNGGWLPGP